MDTEALSVSERHSKHAQQGKLILSVVSVSSLTVKFVVGRVGSLNVERSLTVGGAVLFETPDDGLFEVRIMNIGGRLDTAEFLISRLMPGQGYTAGVPNEDLTNTPFSADEVTKVRGSLKAVQQVMQDRGGLTPEQLDYLGRKLDDIADAANRVCRKDWMNLAMGALANLVVTAGLGTLPARLLFETVRHALGWLIGEAIKYLP
jgi:hypothetical protein